VSKLRYAVIVAGLAVLLALVALAAEVSRHLE
jgi:hypothetical protein